LRSPPSQTTIAPNASRTEGDSVEFLVEFEVNVPEHTSKSEVTERETAEAAAAAKLVDEGHLLRVWKRPVGRGESKILGLYRADSEAQLDALLAALPLRAWMDVAVTPLEPHPNDPGGGPGGHHRADRSH
jgi:muconolactone D-isomerase